KPVMAGADCQSTSCGRPSSSGDDSARMAVAVRALAAAGGESGVGSESLVWAFRVPAVAVRARSASAAHESVRRRWGTDGGVRMVGKAARGGRGAESDHLATLGRG